jgi:hypothetical protein
MQRPSKGVLIALAATGALWALGLFSVYQAEQAPNGPAPSTRTVAQPPDPYAGAEQARRKQTELRQRRAIYECMLRNSGKPGISESTLMVACTDFPNLGSSWFGR